MEQTSQRGIKNENIISINGVKITILLSIFMHTPQIIKVNKINIQDRIWFLSDHIPLKCKEKHPKLKTPNWNKIENTIRGYYEIWVKLNRNYSILDGLIPKIHSFQYAGDPIKWGLVSNMKAIYNENPAFWFDYLKRIYTDIVIDICNLIGKPADNNTISFPFYTNYGHLKGTDIAKQIEALLEPYHSDKDNDFETLKKLRNKLLAHTDLDYLPTKDANELFSKLQNLPIDLQPIHNFLEMLSRFFEAISKYYELRIDFKLHEITTTMDSDPLIKDVNKILRKLDIYPVQKYTVHKRIEFDITKETIEKCHKEKKELDTVKNIIKNYAECPKGKIYFIDENEIGLDDDQLNVLISKHVTTWIKNDDGVTPYTRIILKLLIL